MSEMIRLATDGPLAVVTLDRPPVNVLTIEMMRDLAAALRAAAAAPAVRVVRLDARGKAFSAGVDVGDHMGDKLPAMMDALDDLFRTLEAIPQPIVAVVQGAALGGGCEILAGCDLVVAGERATFGQPEIRLGVFAPPASVLLPRLIGERRAMGLLLTGEIVTATEAERIGLVNRVFPDASLEAEATAWIGRLLDLSGAALRLAKRAVTVGRGLPARQAHRDLHRIYMDELMRTEDASEGLAAFVEKRTPTWKHR